MVPDAGAATLARLVEVPAPPSITLTRWRARSMLNVFSSEHSSIEDGGFVRCRQLHRSERAVGDGAMTAVRTQCCMYLVLRCEWTGAIVDQLGGDLVREVDQDPRRETIVVLRNVTFVDGAFVRLLKQLRQACGERGSAWHVVEPPNAVRQLCEGLQVDTVLVDVIEGFEAEGP